MKTLICVCLVVIALSLGLRGYWSARNDAFKAGAVHGSDMAFVYMACMNQWPTDKAIREMVMYVNNPHSLPCEWFKQFKYD